MRTKEYLYKVCEEFFDTRNIIDIKELTTGNINETYIVEFPKCRYILQLLNAHVYYSPIGVMNNTRLIVDHIRKKCIFRGCNAHKTVLNFIKTKYNQDLAIIDNEYWRCSEYIEKYLKKKGCLWRSIQKSGFFQEKPLTIGLLHSNMFKN